MATLQRLLNYENTFLKIGIAIFLGSGVAHWSAGMMEEAKQDGIALGIVAAVFIFNSVADRLEAKKQKQE